MTTTERLGMKRFRELAPGVYQALSALGREAVEAGFDKELIELVKLRASQLNGCAYCLQYHLNLARGLDMEPAKLDLLSAWREVALYTPRERTALALTEALTRVTDGPPTQELYDEALAAFGETGLAQLVAMIGTINLWNRIGATFNFAPPIKAKA